MGLSLPLGSEFGYLQNLHFDYCQTRQPVNFADHLSLVDPLVVALGSDLAPAVLRLVGPDFAGLGRFVPVGFDLDLAIHFAHFAGLVLVDLGPVGFVLADRPVVLDLTDLVRMETALAVLDLAGLDLVVLAPVDPVPVGLAQMVIAQMEIDPDQMEIVLVRSSRPLVLTVLGFGLGLVQFRLEADQFRSLYLLDLFRRLVP